jgi:Fe-S cluster assembly protein SufD
VSDAIPRWIRAFAERRAALCGAGLPWLTALREDALERVRAGFPTKRDEEWRYTDVSALLAGPFEPAAPRGGHRAPAGGVRVSTLREALEREPERLAPLLGRVGEAKAHGFAALNAALFEDGWFVEIEPGAEPVEPVELDFGPPDPDTAALTRVLVLAGAGSRATVVERYGGEGPYLRSAASEAVLAEGARLDHVRVQRESHHAFHVASLAARQEASSRFRSCSIAVGGRVARVDVDAVLAAEGAECRLNGLVLARGSQVIDHCTGIDHAMPHTSSRELYESILDGRARGVFRGRVHVRPHAQKIDAAQSSRNLLLSDDAVCNTKPQLEIYADDVKCSHGATIGRLSEEAVFYLRSRGIPLEEARALLTAAFAGAVLEDLPSAPLRAELEGFVRGWLAAGAGR